MIYFDSLEKIINHFLSHFVTVDDLRLYILKQSLLLERLERLHFTLPSLDNYLFSDYGIYKVDGHFYLDSLNNIHFDGMVSCSYKLIEILSEQISLNFDSMLDIIIDEKPFIHVNSEIDLSCYSKIYYNDCDFITYNINLSNKLLEYNSYLEPYYLDRDGRELCLIDCPSYVSLLKNHCIISEPLELYYSLYSEFTSIDRLNSFYSLVFSSHGIGESSLTLELNLFYYSYYNNDLNVDFIDNLFSKEVLHPNLHILIRDAPISLLRYYEENITSHKFKSVKIFTI